MTKEELARDISNKTGLSIREAKTIVQVTFDSIANALSNDDKVVIAGFGTFNTKKRGGLKAENPATDDILGIPFAVKPVFEPSKKLKEKVNKTNAT